MNEIVTFGETMLRLATPGYSCFQQTSEYEATFGGGESNVAVSLANFGLSTEFVTRLPKNDIAESAVKTLRLYRLGTQHIQYGGNRMGIYFLESGAVFRGSKVVYDRAHSAMVQI
jgi:2-dehydro-3-deoxygluconokinase